MIEANQQYVSDVASASAMATVSATVTASASAAASASCAAVDLSTINNNINNNNAQGKLFYSTIANSCQKINHHCLLNPSSHHPWICSNYL